LTWYGYKKLANNILAGDASSEKLPAHFCYYVSRDYVDTLSMNWIVRPEKAVVAEIATSQCYLHIPQAI